MPTTINSALPNEWRDSTTYYEGDLVVYAQIIYKCLQTSTNNPPNISEDYWKALDIYVKDSTVMEHGDYSGDEEFWNRDNIYIDSAGWVYINNEKTGINVTGPRGGVTVDFDELTPAQLEQIRGPQGNIGPQGPAGPQGPQGPAGTVTLTPEQEEALKGDSGKSAYDIWIDQGYSGTEADFLAWLRSGAITIDEQLDFNSANTVENQAVTRAFQQLKNNLIEEITLLKNRVTELEERLQYEYNQNTYHFNFGITTDGDYGYFVNDSATIIPFNYHDSEVLASAGVMENANAFALELGDSANIDTDNLSQSPIIYSENAEVLSFEDMFDSYVYMYKNGIFYNADYDLGMYNMNYDYVNPQTTTNLTSKSLAIGEGVIFSPLNVSNTASVIHFVVEPITAGDTINYQIGRFTNSAANLPTLVTAGTYRTEYTNGSLTESTVVTSNIRPGEGIYFASTSICGFKITEIYLD